MKYLIYVAKGEKDEIIKEYQEIQKLEKTEDIIIEDIINDIDRNHNV